MVDADGKPIYGEVSDKEILAHLDRHSKAVMKDFYRTSEFCGACHKAALPRMLNGYKWQRAIFLYDEWQQASFAKQSPLPFYVKTAGLHVPDLPHGSRRVSSSRTMERSKAS